MSTIRLGFLPLVDAAPLIVARELGLFRKQGITVDLCREVSWANIRDRVAVADLQGAQMLAPLPAAMTLGLAGLRSATITALSLNLNGNGITVANSLYRALAPARDDSAMTIGKHLQRLLRQRASQGQAPLVFAVVHRHSMHNYLLRYWLAACGINPDRDVQILVLPPQLMATALRDGQLDGCCVGEPWNTVATMLGAGSLLLPTAAIWRNHPEKVLGINGIWADQHPDSHCALVTAVAEAGRWLDQPDHHQDAAAMLSAPDCLDIQQTLLQLSLDPDSQPGFGCRFHRAAAGFPWRSHGAWILSQMQRWGQLGATANIQAVAAEVWRTDLHRGFLAGQGDPIPHQGDKLEGAHANPWVLRNGNDLVHLGADQFCDRRVFDPADISGYLAQPAARPYIQAVR